MRESTLTERAWSIPRLRASIRLVLLAMCHISDATGVCRTTPRKLSHMVGCDLRTAQKATRWLADEGLLEWVDVRGGRGRDNTYRVLP